ncbi:MAG: hypothetical protein H7834_03165 [Magnetococcus sp. YQC-9]
MSHEQVARILSRLDRRTTDRILAHLEEQESTLAHRIRDNMVLFEDLGKLDKRGLQTLLQEVTDETLAVALRGELPELVARFKGNLSHRRAEELHEALMLAPPQPRPRVEQARREILETARQLQARGLLILPSRSEPMID